MQQSSFTHHHFCKHQKEWKGGKPEYYYENSCDLTDHLTDLWMPLGIHKIYFKNLVDVVAHSYNPNYAGSKDQ
jgi:hypothetical protein